MSRQLVMKPIEWRMFQPISFLLPPPFVVHTPTPEQTRTLTNVLDSQDGLLKLFAFTDLRRIAWTDRNRRLEVFSLSQPGGHPRNWTNVSTTCINILERIRSDLEQPPVSDEYPIPPTSIISGGELGTRTVASSRLPGGPCLDGDMADMSEEDLVEVDREMLMMPHKSRKQ
ncbi:hypothetical protein ANCDUO_25949, partial [Ancylostoma duodenale]